MSEAFESIANRLLQQAGYWTLGGWKFHLRPEQKKALRAKNSPRIEIDLVALSASRKEVIAFEAKNYLDSGGVPFAHVTAKYAYPTGKRYKLFTCKRYRYVVLPELRVRLIEGGFLPQGWDGKMRLGLIAAHVQNDHEDQIRRHFAANEWEFWGATDVEAEVNKLAALDYEDDATVITAKILVRAGERRVKATEKAAKAMKKVEDQRTRAAAKAGKKTKAAKAAK